MISFSSSPSTGCQLTSGLKEARCLSHNPCSLFLMDDLPQLLSSAWHINMSNTESISNSCSHSRGRANRASLTDAFDSKWVDRSQGDGVIQLEGRELRGHRHGVIHKC